MIDQELRQRAEELYVIDALTLEQVAAATGISERTIQNWSVEDGWLVKRKEFKNAAFEIRKYKQIAKLKLIQDAVTSLDPQKIYAFARLDKETKQEIVIKADKPAIFLECIEFIASVLKDTDPEGLKVLAANFDELISRYKALNAQTT